MFVRRCTVISFGTMMSFLPTIPLLDFCLNRKADEVYLNAKDTAQPSTFSLCPTTQCLQEPHISFEAKSYRELASD